MGIGSSRWMQTLFSFPSASKNESSGCQGRPAGLCSRIASTLIMGSSGISRCFHRKPSKSSSEIWIPATLKWTGRSGLRMASTVQWEKIYSLSCMAANGVDKVEAFDISVDGACPAKRPEDEKKNKKWKSDCNVKVPAMHPFKKPAAYFECLDTTMAL